MLTVHMYLGEDFYVAILDSLLCNLQAVMKVKIA